MPFKNQEKKNEYFKKYMAEKRAKDKGLVVKPAEPQSSKLWSDYYSVKKPTCPTCQQKGISATEYRFCSEELIAPQEYKCLVKHFTIYQGKNFLR